MPAALDTIRSAATPEGVELDLRLAGPVPRAYAWGINLVLRLFILLVLSLVLITQPELTTSDRGLNPSPSL